MPGGYGGLGEAICWGLAIHGATVVIGGCSEEKALTLAESLAKAGYAADVRVVDVESVTSIRDSAGAVVQQHGQIDILVNCVGIQREEPLLEVIEEAYEEVQQTHTTHRHDLVSFRPMTSQ